MKKGLVGPFQLGVLGAFSDVLKFMEKSTGERGADLESIFYASAFQAGLDKFLVPKLRNVELPRSNFLIQRTTLIPDEISERNHRLVHAAFTRHLPEDWLNNSEYGSAWNLSAFISDLLDAMSLNASLLLPGGVPSLDKAVNLPSELLVPVTNLISSFSDFQLSSPIPQKIVAREEIERFNDLLQSDIFSAYASTQTYLDSQDRALSEALSSVEEAGLDLFAHNARLLKRENSTVSVLQISPKIIEAVFGKLPGALAEVAAKLGIDHLENRRRIVIYDARTSLFDLLLSNLHRMMKSHRDKGGEGLELSSQEP